MGLLYRTVMLGLGKCIHGVQKWVEIKGTRCIGASLR